MFLPNNTLSREVVIKAPCAQWLREEWANSDPSEGRRTPCASPSDRIARWRAWFWAALPHSPLPPMGPFRPFPATMGQDPTPRTPQQPRPHGASLLTHPAPPLCQGKFDNLPKPVITPYLLLCMRNCRQELLRALSA